MKRRNKRESGSVGWVGEESVVCGVSVEARGQLGPFFFVRRAEFQARGEGGGRVAEEQNKTKKKNTSERLLRASLSLAPPTRRPSPFPCGHAFSTFSFF